LRALRIDDKLAEAHSALGTVHATYDWDWPGAQREFTQAIALSPHDGTILLLHGIYLDAIGRADDALGEAKRSQELEPLSLIINSVVGLNFYYTRQSDRAIAELRKSLELDPNFARTHRFLGMAYEQQARYEEAIAEFQRGLALSGGESEIAGALGHTYAVSGKKSEAEKVLADMKEQSTQHYVSPFDIALIYLGRGAKSTAFEWLDKAYEDHSASLGTVKVDPRLDGVRDDPRYHDLLRRLRLPE
jgi:Flp pilus assembly protein TadD